MASTESNDRLDSWKAIAAYLRRTERTARRWEQSEGLPVHRLVHQERSSIYAYKRELDSWLAARRERGEVDPGEPAAGDRRRTVLIAAALGVALIVVLGVAAYWLTREPPSSAASAQPLSSDPRAMHHFRRGLNLHINPGRSQIQSAIEEFRAAVEIDPEFAAAHSSLAIAYVASTFFGEVPAKETMALAKAAANKALSLDPQAFGAHMALAGASHWHDFDHVAAERHFRDAIAAAPGEAAARNWYAEYLIEMLRFDDAAAANREATEIDPSWLEADIVRGNILLFQDRASEAIPYYEAALKKEPNHGLTHYFLGYARLLGGREREAVKEFELANQVMGNVPLSRAALGFARARAGEREEAARMLLEFQRLRESGYYPAFALAMIHAGLGNRAQALEWLDRAVDEGVAGYYLPSVEIAWESLRDDARFRRVLSRLQLPEPEVSPR